MNTLEMIKAITEDKTKNFECNDSSKSVVCFVELSWNTLVWKATKTPFTINDVTLCYNWTEVEEPMTFMEAMEHRKTNRCTLRCVSNGSVYIYPKVNVGLVDHMNRGVTPQEVLDGKWYAVKEVQQNKKSD